MESPVAKKRGRPRKRRREDEDGSADGKLGVESKKHVVEAGPIVLLGRYMLKEFGGSGVFLGKVVYYADGLYRVNYEDGDFEDLESREIRGRLMGDGDFNRDLSARRRKLDELVARNAANPIDRSNERSESIKDADGVEKSASVEMGDGPVIEGDEAEVDGDAADSLSDSCEFVGDRSLGFEEDASVVPPPELPPSSGTIGVPEQYVSHLFSVYGFLRSYSICLFLSPFTLDDFVGALNCRTPNTLLDSIHVAIMRALRRHLETLSADGVELASKCLRCIDWCLLDMLTWPVYLVQYLTIMGYTKGQEWKGFYDEVSGREYYSLPAGRKLLVLQVLCDDVLDSVELRSELDMREESEVGIDYDEETTNPPENGPRRVHPRYSKTSACKEREAIGVIGETHMLSPPNNRNFRSSKGTKGDMNAADMDLDRNSDECRLCGMDGTLLCCDGCPSAYHTRCIGVMKLSIPEGSWYCPECTIRKIGPAITPGTSLKGADIFGIDSYGQIFLGTCNHLLVFKALVNEEPCLRYYSRKDIPKVLQVLCLSPQHGNLYLGIFQEILKYWDIPRSVISLIETTVTDTNATKQKEETNFSLLPPPPALKDNFSNTVSVNENIVDTGTASLETSIGVVEYLTYVKRTCGLTEYPVKGNGSIGSVSQLADPSDSTNKSLVEQSSAIGLNTCTSVSSNCSYSGRANGITSLVNLSSQRKESDQIALRKGENDSFADCVYTGALYKPQAYLNQYMHGEFAASAAAKLAVLLSEEARSSESHAPDNSKKVASENFLQTKAFSLIASRFFWPTSEKKLVEVPRERCGWCLSCKASVSSKRGCMLNHAGLSATKSAMKILASFRPIKSGEGSLASIRTYILYMEESLCGLIVGPFMNANHRKQWRKQVEQASTCCEIKTLLLELEDNIRTIALSSDWVKLVDDWSVEYSATQNAASASGTAQKRGPGRRGKKQSSMPELADDNGHEKSFVWWQGGQYSKLVFQKAILPRSMMKRAARQGGSRKISGICYTDGSEIPKRSRRLAWRAAVEMSRNASQLALQVRYLDLHVRWSDLVHPEQNLPDGKNAETEASVFRNALICSKKVVENKVSYGVEFGSQKHLPSRVMKSIIEIEQSQEGPETFWFLENRVPLYLIKVYERRATEVLLPSTEEPSNFPLQEKRLKAPRNDIFFYLVCKRDNLEICTCISCQQDLVLRTAVMCGVCKGYCHRDCTISSTLSTNEEVEFLITCKQCYQAKVLAQNVTCNESPTSPLHLQVPQYQKLTATKGPKSNYKAQNACSETKLASSESHLTAKSRRKLCNWGIMWKKRNGKDASALDQKSKDASSDFRQNNILLKGGSGHLMKPECYICHQSYRSDLMYIRCEACKKWVHADAVELEESKIFDVVGFKCCKCRRIRSPVCPYADPKEKMERKRIVIRPLKQENSGVDSDSGTAFYSKQIDTATSVNKMKKTCITPLKQESSEVDSDSGTILYSKQSEPSTPMFPFEEASLQDNDPLLFSLSSVDLVLEPDIEMESEWDTGRLGPQKLPVRRQVKHEGDVDGFPDGSFDDVDFYTHNAMANPLENTAITEWDASVQNIEGGVMFDDGGLDFENSDYEPQTLFTFSELLGVDASGDEPTEDQGKRFYTISQEDVPEQYRMTVSNDESMPMASAKPSVKCQLCLHGEQEPDFSCHNCGLWVHSYCLPSAELSSWDGAWKCSNCREWR